MSSRQPLNDSWLFWNAERLEEFPHVSEDDCTCASAGSGAEEGDQGARRPAVLENLLLYVGGVSAALVGVGLVLLIGSFLSAYSALNDADASGQAALPARPHLSLRHSAPSAKVVLPEAIVSEPAEPEAKRRGRLSPTQGTATVREPSGI